MELAAVWFHSAVLPAAAVLWLLFAVCSVRRAWRALHHRSTRTAAALLLGAFLWWLRIEVPAGGHMQGMVYHLLGINLLCLMLGAPAAFWLGSLYAAGFTLLLHGAADLPAVPLTVLAVVLPACAVNVLLRRGLKLPENLFVYIFANGFLGAALGMLLTGLTVCSLLAAAGVFSLHTVWRDVFPVFFLLSWSEAFLSGIFTAVFVALQPQLLATFDDGRYLVEKTRIWHD